MAAADIFRKMRGPQNLSLPPRLGAKPIASVTEIEIEAKPEAPQHEEAEGDEETAKIAAGYIRPGERCATCANCDRSSTCTLYSFTCEPDGGCPDYEAKQQEASAVPSAPEEPPTEPAG